MWMLLLLRMPLRMPLRRLLRLGKVRLLSEEDGVEHGAELAEVAVGEDAAVLVVDGQAAHVALHHRLRGVLHVHLDAVAAPLPAEDVREAAAHPPPRRG